METSNLSVNTNQLINQKIRKLGNFSRVTGYLYLIITIVPIIIFFLNSIFLKSTATNTTSNNHPFVAREDLALGMDNAINDSLEPLLPIFIFCFISFIILNIFLIYISNQIIKYGNQEINKRLKSLSTVSILILIIFSPLLITILSPLAILDIKIISDIFEIKRISSSLTPNT
jgi:hypothetical protein